MQMYMGQNWLRRKMDKRKHKRDAVNQRDDELTKYAMSVRGLVKPSAVHWEWE